MASRAGLPMQDIRSMQYDYLFFVEYFTLDLRMSDDGHCLVVLAMSMEDGSIHSSFRSSLHSDRTRRL